MYRLILMQGDQHDPYVEIVLYAHTLNDLALLANRLDTPIADAVTKGCRDLERGNCIGTTLPSSDRTHWVHIEHEDVDDLVARERDYEEVGADA